MIPTSGSKPSEEAERSSGDEAPPAEETEHADDVHHHESVNEEVIEKEEEVLVIEDEPPPPAEHFRADFEAFMATRAEAALADSAPMQSSRKRVHESDSDYHAPPKFPRMDLTKDAHFLRLLGQIWIQWAANWI